MLYPHLFSCFTPQGFDHHVKHDHNMWAYIYYSIYLDGIDISDHNAIEQYVYGEVHACTTRSPLPGVFNSVVFIQAAVNSIKAGLLTRSLSWKILGVERLGTRLANGMVYSEFPSSAPGWQV